MAEKVSIRIDGELIEAEEGMTLFDVALMSGKFVPGLCQLKGLTSVGACRLCVVEVAGVNRMLPSCTTPIQAGMSVVTNSARLSSYRKMVLELLFAEGNHVCAVCVSNNHCELQALAQKLDVMSRGTSSRVIAEMNKPWGLAQSCTSCGKCVQVCPTGALAERGFAVGEMIKNPETVTHLAVLRGSTH